LNHRNQDRRKFLKSGGAITAALPAQSTLPEVAQASANVPLKPATVGSMPTRNLGKTAHKVRIFSLGGQSALEHGNNEAIAVPVIECALFAQQQEMWGPMRSGSAIFSALELLRFRSASDHVVLPYSH
jgi:hypothetical protein